jgi:hypothetical protein
MLKGKFYPQQWIISIAAEVENSKLTIVYEFRKFIDEHTLVDTLYSGCYTQLLYRQVTVK